MATNKAEAALISVDWDLDNTPDGMATGTFGIYGVTLTSTNGTTNGGIAGNFLANWRTDLGTNDVPGINSPGIVQEGAAIDWVTGQSGFVTVDFGGATLTNPILLFNFADGIVETFDFSDNILITILDQNPLNSVSIASGNIITTNGSHSNSNHDGFAIQLTGNFSSITFNTNTNLQRSESLGFSVFVDEQDIQEVVVPEPSSILGFLALGILGSTSGLKRRLGHSEKDLKEKQRQ
ncbi:PEP-CTERM sorting domain-containing protein [Crocosphaera sp. XPORK-15E]|uniref:PEP-CTERM sorting domain-containing protein n=1 Tax=Crocosphaera sp. XPORK-15E TaxID=3110247 RepID=UPI002B216F99|nr:PEP-CTERM sorting domain-containing protein [Crocosphaera sp. XPORK-15E]MEA5535510.1 PEP-CTERM sorting domain-containing protein [Crocosphaera sp. XPORK-15E]